VGGGRRRVRVKFGLEEAMISFGFADWLRCGRG
jgi:hypothetical protein